MHIEASLQLHQSPCGRPVVSKRLPRLAVRCHARSTEQSLACPSTQPQLSRRAALTAAGAALLLPQLLLQDAAIAAGSTVFVAGASGATGRRVVQQLINKGISVRAGLRDPKKAESLGWGGSVDPVQADVTEGPEKLAAAIGNADVIICAIGAGGSDLSGPRKVDYEGTVHLIDAAKQAGVKKFVLMSSLLTNGAAVGQSFNPNYLFLNLFGGVLKEKLKAEKYLRSSGLDWIIVRPGGLSNAPPQEVGNLYIGEEDTLFGDSSGPGKSISRDTVAEVLIEAALQGSAKNRVVEVVAGKNVDAPPKEKWFA